MKKISCRNPVAPERCAQPNRTSSLFRKMWGTALIRCYHRRVQNQPLKWWHVRWRPVARGALPLAIIVGTIIGIVCVLGAALSGVFYLMQPWQVTQALAAVKPQIDMVPISLPNQAQAPLSKTSVDAFGFRFQLPNKGIDKTRVTRRIIFASFRDGGTLLVEDMSPFPGADSIPLVAELNKRAERALGQELAHSEFKRMQAAMSTTPDQVKWWRLRSSRNMRAAFLLEEKFSDLIGCTSPRDPSGPVYAISFGQFHGIQCGDPDAPPYDAHVEVFDAADRHFRMFISCPYGHGRVLTQEELNAMVASIRVSPEN